jgi:hypothetical protein
MQQRCKRAHRQVGNGALELCPFDLDFTHRDTIKSQTLADFMVEWTDLSIPTSQGPVDYWKMYFDDSLTIDGAGAGILFTSPTNEQLRHVFMACALQSASVSSAFTSMATRP